MRSHLNASVIIVFWQEDLQLFRDPSVQTNPCVPTAQDMVYVRLYRSLVV
jgi:hypothetical protein